jgi:hypothetical protein
MTTSMLIRFLVFYVICRILENLIVKYFFKKVNND